MSFILPSDPKALILEIWKIIDLKRINLDYLNRVMAYDLKIGTPAKCKDLILKLIHESLLIEFPEQEEVELCIALQEEYDSWQKEGYQKGVRMQGLLKSTWREPLKLGENEVYKVFEQDLIDNTVYDKAIKILTSAVKIDIIDFSKEISGLIELKSNDQIESFNIKLDIKNKIIQHQCLEYSSLRQQQKKFCIHIARVLIKLYAQDKQKTFKLVQDIVQNRDQWKFQ